MEQLYGLFKIPSSNPTKTLLDRCIYIAPCHNYEVQYAGVDPDVQDCKVAHELKDWVKLAYNSYLPELPVADPSTLFHLPLDKDFLHERDEASLFLSEEGVIYLNRTYRYLVRDDDNQLVFRSRNLWSRIAGLPAIKKILQHYNSGGWDNFYFLSKEGELYVCGDNKRRQLGVGDVEEVLTSEVMRDLPRIRDIGCHGDFNCMLSEESTLYLSGSVVRYYNESKPDIIYCYPRKVITPPIKEARTNLLTETGLVYYFNDGTWRLLHMPCIIKFASISDKPNFFIARKGVYELWDGDTLEVGLRLEDEIEKVVDIDGYNVFIITKQGKLYVLGDNADGGLGLGDNKERWEVPILVPDLPPVRDVCQHDIVTVLLTREGDLYGAGTKWRRDKSPDEYLKWTLLMNKAFSPR